MASRKASPAFPAYADDSTVQTIAGLTVENGTTRIALHGTLDITRDRTGLGHARTLRDLLGAVVKALEAADLPETVAENDEPPTPVRNPFA
ncbi:MULTISPECIES: hypothetical protein [Methylobacterium]|uniref:Uncharacterized protein n=1 Tax=Methylobacterium jeotgali TaxID=381630 RepID=A0ABQ4T4A6_9HYPH|nr:MULTISPECIES: hypothetical protein [Methylobacterium]PIU04499.1 MAG: hypothetical protein COT56_19835 [Methylobacterium sp. CG09_land_8_20_14_0_10_71_15]PIU16543.1 MAG: hypothetical protein COT28_00015 [Methylobacterium sp. CG08_land_8_20_14_0_20_71_15]GBU19743.1 hypothetical protein AwMethylo_39580 [Methylobacterium sp.]GJE08874.1 hypothetical protein AOPFMNJM_4220 [Methylobacterium jeotgali]